MNDRSHAGHRPPRDPETRARSDGPPTLLGQVYPTDDVLGVVEDEAVGERVLAALREAGIPAGDVELIGAAEFVAAGQPFDSERGLFERVAGWLSDERNYIGEYRAEAQEGRAVLIVHAEDDATLERMRPVLVAHKVRHLRHYREHTVDHPAAGDSSWASGRGD